jgi:predicted DsbA family dithiol-disulfide isomerase
MPVTVDVVSDVVCPWCFIGKRHLEQALRLWRARHLGLRAEVRWYAFELNPGLPAGGVDRQSYLAEKFGGAARAREIYARVEAAGRRAGVPFDFAAMRVQPNTTDAHRLIVWAGTQGRQDAMVEALFRGFFLDRSDLTSGAVLAALAGEAGLDCAAAAAVLASDAYRDDVRAQEAMARRMGVQGVPFFVFGRRLALSGAQPPEVILEAMEEVSAAQAAATVPSSGAPE